VFEVKGKKHAISQSEIYLARPESLKELCLVAFSCMYDVEEKPEKDDSGKTRNSRYDFQPTFVLAPAYRLIRRSNFPCPVLAGNAPPTLPIRPETRAGELKFRRWAAYFAALVMPHMSVEELEAFTPERMMEWLLSSLHDGRGPVEKARAMFVINSSCKWSRVRKHSEIIQGYRVLFADKVGQQSTRSGKGKRGDDEDQRPKPDRAHLLSEIFKYVAAGGFENEGARLRAEQLSAIRGAVVAAPVPCDGRPAICVPRSRAAEIHKLAKTCRIRGVAPTAAARGWLRFDGNRDDRARYRSTGP
jgi:hypothetical protein